MIPGRTTAVTGKSSAACCVGPTDLTHGRKIVTKLACRRPVATQYQRKATERASERSSQMAKSPSQPQQGGSTEKPQQQQQGQGSAAPQQQGGQPIFRDWAAI
jgi:hypothetical protein